MLDVGLEGFREALLAEFEIGRKQLLGLSEAIPAEAFAWRPDPGARCVSEVLVHIATGCFFLLDLAGHALPSDLYPSIKGEGEARLWQVVGRNDHLEKAVSSKDAVVSLLARALNVARDSIVRTDETRLMEPVPRRVYLRLLAHTHEHMG